MSLFGSRLAPHRLMVTGLMIVWMSTAVRQVATCIYDASYLLVRRFADCGHPDYSVCSQVPINGELKSELKS